MGRLVVFVTGWLFARKLLRQDGSQLSSKRGLLGGVSLLLSFCLQCYILHTYLSMYFCTIPLI